MPINNHININIHTYIPSLENGPFFVGYIPFFQSHLCIHK